MWFGSQRMKQAAHPPRESGAFHMPRTAATSQRDPLLKTASEWSYRLMRHGFQTGHRRGQVWDDVQTLKIIHNTRFNLTGKSEREFELVMSSVNANADRINGQILSQVDKDTTVRSVYLFGKKHRPTSRSMRTGSRSRSNTSQAAWTA